MRSSEITVGDLYAVDHRIEGERAPSRFRETFPQWKARAREHLGSGRWAVHVLELDTVVEVRSTAIREPWNDYADRMRRQRTARDEVLSKRLTWEQLQDGMPCPGCGRPYVDDLSRVLDFTNAVKAVELLLGEGAVASSGFDSKVYSTLVGNALAEEDQGMLVPSPLAEKALRLRREDERWRENHECPQDIPRLGAHRYGDGPIHCGGCCPPAPLSPQKLDEIARLLSMEHRSQLHRS